MRTLIRVYHLSSQLMTDATSGILHVVCAMYMNSPHIRVRHVTINSADPGGRAAPWLLGQRVRISLWTWCSFLVFIVCCVGSGFCVELITRSVESYRVCVTVWSRNLRKVVAWAHVGLLRQRRYKLSIRKFQRKNRLTDCDFFTKIALALTNTAVNL